MIAALDAHLVRLAFTLRDEHLSALVDTDEERSELDGLRSLTRANWSLDARGYVEFPFDHPLPSRFSDGTFGVLYAGNTLVTAAREVGYHLGKVYTDGNAPPMETRRTRLNLHLRARAADIRRAVDRSISSAVYDPESYRASQPFGIQIRERVPAIHFDSVRNPRGGHCVGAFAPNVVVRAAIAGENTLVWDGRYFIESHEITQL